MRGSATEKLLEIARGNTNRARTARIDLRRYLRRAISLGEINNELDAHELLAQMYLLLGDAAAALGHALAAGDVTRAGEAAAKLSTYYDCLPRPNRRCPIFGQRACVPRSVKPISFPMTRSRGGRGRHSTTRRLA